MNIEVLMQRVNDYLWKRRDIQVKPLPKLSDLVESARMEWLSAQNYYNSVSDQDLVDHAVYVMQAAEKKYIYLLKQARREGIVYSPYPINGLKSEDDITLQKPI